MKTRRGMSGQYTCWHRRLVERKAKIDRASSGESSWFHSWWILRTKFHYDNRKCFRQAFVKYWEAASRLLSNMVCDEEGSAADSAPAGNTKPLSPQMCGYGDEKPSHSWALSCCVSQEGASSAGSRTMTKKEKKKKKRDVWRTPLTTHVILISRTVSLCTRGSVVYVKTTRFVEKDVEIFANYGNGFRFAGVCVCHLCRVDGTYVGSV